MFEKKRQKKEKKYTKPKGHIQKHLIKLSVDDIKRLISERKWQFGN